MFDSVLSKSRAPQGNIAGLGLTLAVCAAIVVTIVLLPSAKRIQTAKPVDVTFVASQPAGPSAQPAAAPAAAAAAAPPAQTQPVPRKPVIKKPDVLHKPVPDPVPVPVQAPDPTPAPQPVATPNPGATGVPGGTQGGVASGIVGGTVGGTVGGVRGGVGQGSGTSALPFGQGMTRPTQVAGKPPEYNREALAARVAGKVLVRCVITVRGTVEDCKIIKGVPMLDKITVDALLNSRFTPVLYQGRPEAVQYLFTFNFKLP
jgi:protein TonB